MYIFSSIICRNYAFQALDLTPDSSLMQARLWTWPQTLALFKLGPWSTTELHPEPQNSVFLMITVWEEGHFSVYLGKT